MVFIEYFLQMGPHQFNDPHLTHHCPVQCPDCIQLKLSFIDFTICIWTGPLLRC